mmetsp:Transcript_52685/g.157814  ORF Transcript_52685/g.157814 Transcript_52685/m.157814 type:complete len:145 (-) Transcript_52685:68-502(-)
MSNGRTYLRSVGLAESTDERHDMTPAGVGEALPVRICATERLLRPLNPRGVPPRISSVFGMEASRRSLRKVPVDGRALKDEQDDDGLEGEENAEDELQGVDAANASANDDGARVTKVSSAAASGGPRIREGSHLLEPMSGLLRP